MKNNPRIDWTMGEVHMIGTPIPHHDSPEIVEQRYLLRYLRAVEWDESDYATQIYAQQSNATTLRRVLGEEHPHIQKLTLSTTLAQAAEKVKHKLPHNMLSMPRCLMNQKMGSSLPDGPSTMPFT